MKTIDDMKNININKVNPEELVDRNMIVLDEKLSRDKRVEQYIEKIKNPYCYKVDGVVVKISFAKCAETIDDRLEAYARSIYSEKSTSSTKI